MILSARATKSKHRTKYVAGRRNGKGRFSLWRCWTVKSSLHLTEQQPEAAGAVCFCTPSACCFLTVLLGLTRFSPTLKFSASSVKLLFKAQPRIVLLEKDWWSCVSRETMSCATASSQCLLPLGCWSQLCSFTCAADQPYPKFMRINGRSHFFPFERRCALVFWKNLHWWYLLWLCV